LDWRPERMASFGKIGSHSGVFIRENPCFIRGSSIFGINNRVIKKTFDRIWLDLPGFGRIGSCSD
jgi:hypothetical protein